MALTKQAKIVAYKSLRHKNLKNPNKRILELAKTTQVWEIEFPTDSLSEACFGPAIGWRGSYDLSEAIANPKMATPLYAAT